jgi:hypothetical protein
MFLKGEMPYERSKRRGLPATIYGEIERKEDVTAKASACI